MTVYERRIKSLLDRALGIAGLVILAPILLAIAVVIYTFDGRPALFTQERVGAGGKTFTLYKFRTYPVGTPQLASHEADAVVPYPLGKVLRRVSLDELPQLLNVANGTMSLVGPRPALPSQEDVLAGRRSCGAVRLRPGMTGLAQVRSYDNMPVVEKVELDCQYASSLTATRDAAILVMTVGYLMKPPPVY